MIPDFMAQGGDPTGTGRKLVSPNYNSCIVGGGESIYG